MRLTRQEVKELTASLNRLLLVDETNNVIKIENKGTGQVSFSASRLAIQNTIMALNMAPLRGDEFPIRFTRKELRVLQSYLKHTIYYIASVTIPGYQARITRAPQDKKLGLTAYLENAKIRLDKTQELLKRVEACL